MKITLIYPNVGNIPSYSFGLGIIAANLKNNGHEILGICINSESASDIDLEKIEKEVREFGSELIAFSSVSNQYKFVQLVAKYLKERIPDAKILVGGIHATIMPEEVMAESYIDLVCRGEGEEALLELVNRMEKGEDIFAVKNICLKKDNGIIKNGMRPIIEDLDSLPYADRSLFGFGEMLKEKRGWVNILAGRGCPFLCNYCVNHYYRKLNNGKTLVRLRSVENILGEIELIEKDHDIAMLNFTDDTFTIRKSWTLEFCEKYSKKFKYPFACNARATHFDKELAVALKKAGCEELKIGLESGSRRVRSEVLNREMSNEQIETAFKVAADVGLRTWSFNMIGMPSETQNDLLETVKLNAKIRPYILRCSILFPYQGTKLYERCVKEDLINEESRHKYASYFDGSILKLKHLSEADILRYKTLFKWYVDAYSDIESAEEYQSLIKKFETLPAEEWLNGEAQKKYNFEDEVIDNKLKELKKEHYSSRSHLDLNYSEKTNWELP